MKKILVMLAGWVAITSMVQAQTCPEADYDVCTGDGYAIVETEPVVYWPHNQMEAAHWTGTQTVHRRISRHHRRVHRHHRTHRKHRGHRHHAKRCSCSCR